MDQRIIEINSKIAALKQQISDLEFDRLRIVREQGIPRARATGQQTCRSVQTDRLTHLPSTPAEKKRRAWQRIDDNINELEAAWNKLPANVK